MAWFSGLRAIVYLKRISESLARIAEFTDAQMPNAPKRSRRSNFPSAEVIKPTVSEWNEGYRERNADIAAPGEWK